MNSEISNVPQHIAIIMDGNGRWAKKRFMPRVYGHRKGVQTIKEISICANELGVKVLTLYAFSTENWGRPSDEVNFLMKLPFEFFSDFLPELLANNIKVEMIGDPSALPTETAKVMQDAIERTKHCSGLILNFAINYGARTEIIQAVRQLYQKLLANNTEADAMTEEMLAEELMTAKLGAYQEPDLVIRTSGEQRLSNFLLWQAAYSELYFTDVHWPDFNRAAFDQAIQAYQQRDRRFGKLSDNQHS